MDPSGGASLGLKAIFKQPKATAYTKHHSSEPSSFSEEHFHVFLYALMVALARNEFLKTILVELHARKIDKLIE